MKVHHLNCVQIESPLGSAIGHCMLLEEQDKFILIDAGIGLSETKEPELKLGKELIEITGFKFDEEITAIKQIEKLGINPNQVKDCIISHLDPDHIGGLADFPNLKIHLAKEEHESFKSGNKRYLQNQLEHGPKTRLYKRNDGEWFGLPSRKLGLDFETEIYLIPLFGHTLGHCGITFKNNGKWIFYVGDAYYLRGELENKNHPVDELATIRAEDNVTRKKSLDNVRKVLKDYGNEIEHFGYHDPTEFKN
ncbi:putative metallo-hydrolase [Flagellimonas maritima]|uniref:Putative metallo-hydrolase n=1 Tax=Flagellimonas maritima TaxID=1383885 RepID=A0A2Z4LSV7_9FLAO|nr:MBL fold metallo-hydrolase [Allomuricauda aurantiaca]AWX45011.1 putative metallo-hydrolase [Allomuricauda aurantiaca]